MICQHCRNRVPEGEPSYRISEGDTTWSHRWGGRVGYLCKTCKDEYCGRVRRNAIWRSPLACEHCDRPVFHDQARDVPRHVVCSLQCRVILFNRLSRRGAANPRVCEACGEEFQPKRFDARYCSPACRQKAYRERTSDRSEVSRSESSFSVPG